MATIEDYLAGAVGPDRARAIYGRLDRDRVTVVGPRAAIAEADEDANAIVAISARAGSHGYAVIERGQPGEDDKPALTPPPDPKRPQPQPARPGR